MKIITLSIFCLSVFCIKSIYSRSDVMSRKIEEEKNDHFFFFKANKDSVKFRIVYTTSDELDYFVREQPDSIVLPLIFDDILASSIPIYFGSNKTKSSFFDSSISYIKQIRSGEIARIPPVIYVIDLNNDGFDDILVLDKKVSTKYPFYQVFLFNKMKHAYCFQENFFKGRFWQGYDSSLKYVYTFSFNGSRYSSIIQKNIISKNKLKVVEELYYKEDKLIKIKKM